MPKLRFIDRVVDQSAAVAAASARAHDYAVLSVFPNRP
jgi:hypothetical protein